MQRSVSKMAKLTTFSVDIDQLEALVSRLQAMFRGVHPTMLDISASSGNEQFSFDDFDDLRTADGLPAVFSEFSVSVRGYIEASYASVTVSANRSGNTVAASGPSPGWSAGAIEEAVQFANRHRIWIPFAKVSHSSWGLLLIWMILSTGFTPPGLQILGKSGYLMVAWLLALVSLTALLVSNVRIPLAILRTTSNERWWRRYFIELTLAGTAIGLITAALSALAAFLALRR